MKHDGIYVLSFVALALFAGCAKRATESARTLADVPLPVRTIAVTNAPFERAATVQGALDSVESAIVSARIPGPLLEVCVDLGDKVVANETKLFAVDSATASNQVVIAREAAAMARAHVAVAEANVAKTEAVAGAMAEFRVVFEKRTGVSVPQEAVLSRAAGSVVFVAEQDGTAKEVSVRVGLRDGGRAEILEGLTAGAPVVVQGQTQLYGGRKIAQ